METTVQKAAVDIAVEKLEKHFEKFDNYCKEQGIKEEGVNKEFQKWSGEFETLKTQFKETTERLGKVEAEGKVKSVHSNVEYTLKGRIADAIMQKDTIERLAKMQREKSAFSLEIDMNGVTQKAVADMTSGNITGGEAIATPSQQIIREPLRTWHLRDILDVGQTSLDNIPYFKETGGEGDADMQAGENAVKAQLDFDVALTRVNVETLAGIVALSTQVMNDYAFVRSYVSTRLVEKLKLVEDAQLLTGTGVSPDLTGIYPNAPEWAAGSFVNGYAGATEIHVLLTAINQAMIAEYGPTAILLNQTDYTKLLLLTGSDGHFVLNPGMVTGMFPPSIGGVPIIRNTLMTAGNFLVGDFRKGATLYDRESVNIAFSYEDGDNFRRNKVTVRAEERLALVIHLANAFVKGTFTKAKANLDPNVVDIA